MKKIIFLPFVLLLLSADVDVPDNLRKPQKGEAPRYPRDIILGELGGGDASEEAYAFVKKTLSAILRGEKAADADVVKNITAIAPQKFRIAGGRQEEDGASFIFRFIGREKWIVGEIYVRFEAPQPVDGEDAEGQPAPKTKGGWKVDEIVLDEPRSIGENPQTYAYDFSPYERFF